MKRIRFLQSILLAAVSPLTNTSKSFAYMETTYTIQLLRHITLLIKMGKLTILVDPMLSAKDEMEPVGNCGNNIRIPMINLPVGKDELEKIIHDADAVAVTHLHRDHWDAVAQQMIAKNKLIICQPADAEIIKGQGFTNVQPLEHQMDFNGVTISRTGGRHGTGEIGQQMGAVSGFVLNDNRRKVYVAGDTIWCDEVASALNTHQPDYTIVNAGAAKFLTGDPITMTAKDNSSLSAYLPSTKIIAVHMDTVNHCFLQRTDLKKLLAADNLLDKVMVPADGELIHV